MDHTIHDIPPYDANTALLVILTDVPSSSGKEMQTALHSKVQALGPRVLQIWTPSKLTLNDIAYIGEHPDSQAIIYGVAVAAARNGWRRFLVADRLSFRQLEGVTKVGEKKELEVVEVGVQVVVDGDGEAKEEDQRLKVVARRVDAHTVGKEILNAEFENVAFPIEELTEREHRPVEKGTFLHDPDRPLFTTDRMTVTGREEFRSSNQNLASHANREIPPEDTRSHMNIGSGQIGEVEMHPSSFPVYALFPMSGDQLKETEQAMHDAFSQDGEAGLTKKLRIIPWKGNRKATRRELMTLFDTLRYSKVHFKFPYLPVFFLDRPFHAGGEATIGFVVSFYNMPKAIGRVTISSFLNQVEAMKYETVFHEGFSLESVRLSKILHFRAGIRYQEDDMTEVFHHPDKPLYDITPPWLPATRSITCPPVFFFTKHLTASEEQKIKAGLETITEFDVTEDGKKYFCYVPWDRDEDGTPEDMWSTMVNACLAYDDVHVYGVNQIIIVDRESARDGKVIMVEFDAFMEDRGEGEPDYSPFDHTDPSSPYKGIVYARIDAPEAQSMWANLDIANMDFEEYFMGQEDEIHLSRRPDFPPASEDVAADFHDDKGTNGEHEDAE